MVATYNANLVVVTKKKPRTYYIICEWQGEGLPLYGNRIYPRAKSSFVCAQWQARHFNQRVSDVGGDRGVNGEEYKGRGRGRLRMCVGGKTCVSCASV